MFVLPLCDYEIVVSFPADHGRTLGIRDVLQIAASGRRRFGRWNGI